MQICVQKFGGSSLVDDDLRGQVVSRVLEARDSGYAPVIVVSAMGRLGDPYSTDTLIDLVKKVNQNPCMRNMDLLLSCGEIISAVILAETLNQLNIKAKVLTGWQAGIMTDSNHGNARIVSIKPETIISVLEEGQIPIITGFQGHNSEQEVTTLGRGGSDTTAVALGAALKCDTVELYSDVDGVKTADPRLVPDAATLTLLTYREIMELAHLGAKVIHPRAVEIAMEAGLDLKIMATNRQGSGTTITGRTGLINENRICDRVVTGITHIGNRAQVKISGVPDLNKTDYPLMVFETLAKHGVSVDLIYLSPELVAFIIDDQMSDLVKKVLSDLGLNITVDQGYAKVSVVGAGMHGVPGVMARVVSSLQQAKISIYQTTDSHANISCLIKEHHIVSATKALFDEFDLQNEEGTIQ